MKQREPQCRCLGSRCLVTLLSCCICKGVANLIKKINDEKQRDEQREQKKKWRERGRSLLHASHPIIPQSPNPLSNCLSWSFRTERIKWNSRAGGKQPMGGILWTGLHEQQNRVSICFRLSGRSVIKRVAENEKYEGFWLENSPFGSELRHWGVLEKPILMLFMLC